MENLVLERIIELQKNKSKSVREFAFQIGVKQNTLNQQLKKERAISLDTIMSILSSFEDISAEWLLRGKGDMQLQEKEENNDNLDMSERKTYLSIIDRQQRTIDNLNSVIEDYRCELDKVRKAEATEGKGAA